MGYKFIGKQCSKYLWMSSTLKALVILNGKIWVDEILLCKSILLTVNELEESCFIKLIAYSKNISISAIPPKSHEADGSSQPPECFSVSQDLIRCWIFQPWFCSCCPCSNQSNPSFTDFLSCAKVGRVAELPSELSLLPCSSVVLHSGAVACRQLRSPSLVPLGAVLQLSGVSTTGSSFNLRFL